MPRATAAMPKRMGKVFMPKLRSYVSVLCNFVLYTGLDVAIQACMGVYAERMFLL